MGMRSGVVLLKMSPESAPDNGWTWGGGSVVPDSSVVSRPDGEVGAGRCY